MVKYVEISDKKIPVNYGLNALAEYSEMRSVSLDDALNLNTKTMNLMDYLALIYVGIKDGARAAKQDCIFKSIDEFLDFADDNNDVINQVAQIFAEYNKGKSEGKKK